MARSDYSWPADYWAFGCVLFELLTLRRAFDAPSLGELAAQISAVSYDEAALEAAPYPAALRQLASRAGLLHPEPALRTTAERLLPTLLLLLGAAPPCSSGGPSSDTSPWPTPTPSSGTASTPAASTSREPQAEP